MASATNITKTLAYAIVCLLPLPAAPAAPWNKVKNEVKNEVTRLHSTTLPSHNKINTLRLIQHSAGQFPAKINAMRRRHFLAASLALSAQSPEPVLVHNLEELHAAIAAAKPGAIILLADGTWKDADIRFEANGEPSAPITLAAQTPGQVILTGVSRLRFAGRYLVASGLYFKDGEATPDVVAFRATTTRLASHCRLTNSAIVDYSPQDTTRDSKWVSLYGYRNRVDRCYFAGKTNIGATLVVWLPTTGEPNHHWVEHNHFGPRPLLGVNGAETIRVGDSATSFQNSHTVVESNFFDRCNGEVEAISNKSCENVYRHNTFLECEATLTLRHGNRCLVDSNAFFGNAKPNTGGIRIIGEDHRVVNNYFEGLNGTGNRATLALLNGVPDSPLNGYFQIKRALIAHNTAVQCARPLAIGVRDFSRTLAPQQVLIANNHFHGTRSPMVEIADDSATVEYANNIFQGASSGLESQPSINIELEQSPQGYWRPTPAGPAHAAAGPRFPETKKDRLSRPRTIPADIGAVQLNDDADLPARLDHTLTGPNWLDRAT